MTEDEFFHRLHERVSRAWLTGSLVAACVIVFLLEVARAGFKWDIPGPVLLHMGANFGPLVQSGEVWRMLSSIFLHGSLIHLGLNMLALWQVGQFIERLYGRIGMLVLFVGSGLLGSLGSIWWRAEGLSVGASGAIFGLYGTLLVWLLRRRHEIPMSILKPLRSGTLGFIAYSLFAGFALPGIDNAAHIGGLVGGLLLGAGMARNGSASFTTGWRQLSTWAVILAAALLALLLWRTTPQVAKSWQHHVEFSEVLRELGNHDAQIEQEIQALFKQIQARRIRAADAARKIEEDLIPEWQHQMERLASTQIEAQDRPKHLALLRYAVLRQQSLQMLARGLETGQRQWLVLSAQREQEAQAALLGIQKLTP